MPRFLFPNAEELNPFLKINPRVTRALKRQYKGTESTIGQEASLEAKFNRMHESLIRITALLGEIDNSLKLSSVSAEKLVTSVSNATIEVANLLLYISQEVPSLQIFNTSQIETITGLNNNLVSVVQEIDQMSKSLSSSSLSKFKNVVTPLVNDVATLQQKLEGINTTAGTGSLRNFGDDSNESIPVTGFVFSPVPEPASAPAPASAPVPAPAPATAPEPKVEPRDDSDDEKFSEVEMIPDKPQPKEEEPSRKRARRQDRPFKPKKKIKVEEKLDELDRDDNIPPFPFDDIPPASEGQFYTPPRPPRPSNRRAQENKNEEEEQFYTPQRPTRNRRAPERYDPVKGKGRSYSISDVVSQTQTRFL
jgi:hypothetical protein